MLEIELAISPLNKISKVKSAKAKKSKALCLFSAGTAKKGGIQQNMSLHCRLIPWRATHPIRLKLKDELI